MFLFIFEDLIVGYSDEFSSVSVQEQNTEIKAVCDFLESNYMKNITLNELSALTGLSKYYLLRSKHELYYKKSIRICKKPLVFLFTFSVRFQ